MRKRLGRTPYVTLFLAVLFQLSCDSDERLEDDGRPLDNDDPDDAKLCEQRRKAYLAFLDEHSACESDDDCAVVGDCGPHAEFNAVRADAAEEAMERKLELCEEAYDGPLYEPVCRAHKCELKMQTGACCGCPSDAGS